MMADYIFNIKGLTAKDRAQWEKDNLEVLKGTDYFKSPDEAKDRYFRNVSFKNKFGNRADYEQLIQMDPTQRDSLFNASDDNVEDEITLNKTKNAYKNEYNKYVSRDNTLIGQDRREWESLNKLLEENSDLYSRYKGSEYLPLETNNKIDLMSEYNSLVQVYGEEEGKKRFVQKVNHDIAENQPKLDTIWRGLAGLGGVTAGSLITFMGYLRGIPNDLASIVGVDRLFGENIREGYFDNIGATLTNDPWIDYGEKVLKQGRFDVTNDSKKAYNQFEILKTAEEEDSLWEYFTNSPLKFTMELIQQNGFTVASMFAGGAASALANQLFNTAKYFTMAGKIGKTVEDASRLNASLGVLAKLNKWFQASIPAIMGTHEGVINGYETKQAFLEEASEAIDKSQAEAFNKEYRRRMDEYFKNAPLKKTKEGTYSNDYKKAEQQIKLDLLHEFANKRKEDIDKAEGDGNKAALVNTTLNSFINGIGNSVLKAPMFGGRVEKALDRTFVGKLFAKNKFRMQGDDVVANKVTKKELAWNMAKETIGEGVEEYSQDVTDAFATAGAEYDLATYLQKKYNPDAEDALAEGFTENLGAALIAAGEAAVSKEAIRSGIYGALGQIIGVPNAHAIVNPGQTFSNFKDKSLLEKVNTIWRNPLVESYYNSKRENINREESAKAINTWLNQDNNREKLKSLEGALGWAKGMEDAAKNGDEYDFRNHRVGKLVQDYYMIEQLKGTPLYDAYMDRYMSIVNAQEGDEVAQEIAKYDDRPLAEVQKDAQNMLDIMGKVQEATEDLEKSLGNSIPQNTKESLIFGKVMMEDWKERSSKLQEDLNSVELDEEPSGLTTEQKEYIAKTGSATASTKYDKDIAATEKTIENYEKNKQLLTKKQKTELQEAKKKLKGLQKQKEKLNKGFNKVFSEENPDAVLTETDIMSLNAEDRYRMLNPENLSKYSAEQQAIIKNLINKGTAMYSDFQNKVEDAARISEAQKRFLNQYNAALANPNIMTDIENHLKYEKIYSDTEKELNELNNASNYTEFANRLDNVLKEKGLLAIQAAEGTLKDNPFYQKYKDESTILGTLKTSMLNNEKFKNASDSDKNLAEAMLHYLIRNDIDTSDASAVDAAFNEVDENGQSLVTKFINDLNSTLPEDQKISLDNVVKVASLVKNTITSFNKNEDTKKQIDTTPRDNITQEEKPRSIFDSPSATRVASPDLQNDSQSTAQANNEAENNVQDSKNPDSSQNVDNTGTNTSEKNNPEYFNKVDTSVDNILNGAEYGESIPKESKDEVKEVVDKVKEKAASENWTIDDFINNLNSEASKPSDSIAKDLLYKIVQALRGTGTFSSQYSSNTIPLRLFTNANTVLGNLFKQWGVFEYLRKGNNLTKKKLVFITSKDITEAVAKEMGNSYTDNDLPIIVAIKLEKGEKGPLVVKDTCYQPIGVLPSSKDGNARIIRTLALTQQGNENLQVLSNETGASQLISSVSSIDGDSRSNNDANSSDGKPEHSNILKAIFNALTESEKEELDKHTEGSDEYRTALGKLFNRYLAIVVSRINPGKTSMGLKLIYNLPIIKKSGKTTLPITLLNKTLVNYTNIWGKSIKDLLLESNLRSLESINNIKNFLQILEKSIPEFNKALESANNEAISKFNKTFNESLKYWVYSGIGNFQLRETYDNSGNSIISLYLGDELIYSNIENLSNANTASNAKLELLTKLFIPDGNYRNRLQLNVDTHTTNKETIKGYLRDNLLQFNTSINGGPLQVTINTPRHSNTPKDHTITTNTDNATIVETPTVANNGEIIDPDTGLTLDNQKIENPPVDNTSKEEKPITDNTKKEDKKDDTPKEDKKEKKEGSTRQGSRRAKLKSSNILENLGEIYIDGEKQSSSDSTNNNNLPSRGPKPTNPYDNMPKSDNPTLGTPQQREDKSSVENQVDQNQLDNGCL